MRYFTSDWHLGSFNIIGYAKRPFFTASDAARKLIVNCNTEAVAKSDVVFHVGDFWLSGADRHGKVEDVNELICNVDYYINSVNARLVLLTGNHDESNCDTDLKSMMVDLNQNWRNVSVGHYPSYAKEYTGWKGTEQKPHIHLCGHVHQRWLVCWDEKNHVMNVNVGVDVWDYRPVRDAQITELLDYLWNGKVQAPGQMDRVQFEDWKYKNEMFVAAERQRRKAERYAKKGLTDEERCRRKEAAMKAKGLI